MRHIGLSGRGLAVSLVLAIGVGLRLNEWIQRRSLWLDEAMMALNIAPRSWTGLLRPLDFRQVAPPLFLWATKATTLIGGFGETTLRAVPLLAAIASLLLLYRTARVIGDSQFTLVTAWMGAVSPLLVIYAAELKPYSSDALVALMLTLVSVHCVRESWKPPYFLAFVFFSCVAVLLSAPAVFVLVTMLAVLGFDCHDRHCRFRLLRWAAAWTSVFAILYAFIYRASVAQSYMALAHFWEHAFLDPRAAGFLKRLSLAVSNLAGSAFGAEASHVPKAVFSRAVLLAYLITAGAGLVRFLREDWRIGSILFGPVIVAAFASAAHLYPFSPRLMLFAVPGLLLLLAKGVHGVSGWAGRHLHWSVRLCAIFAFLAFPTINAYERLKNPQDPAPAREVIQALSPSIHSGDVVYVFERAVPVWIWYTTNWQHPDTSRLSQLLAMAKSIRPNSGDIPRRAHSVEKEGDSLRLETNGIMELVGIPTGVEMVEAPSQIKSEPDSGWGTNEARRIAGSLRNGRAWLFFTHGANIPAADLINQLKKNGAVIELERRRHAVIMDLARFPDSRE